MTVDSERKKPGFAAGLFNSELALAAYASSF